MALELEQPKSWPVLEPSTATAFGLSVRGSGGKETLIGYNVVAEEMLVDKQDLGEVSFSSDFPGATRDRSYWKAGG